MTEIRIITRLESDTPHLPDLAPFVGKEVEIVVRDMTGAMVTPTGYVVYPGNGDWAAAAAAARELRESGGYDFDAFWRNRGHDPDLEGRSPS